MRNRFAIIAERYRSCDKLIVGLDMTKFLRVLCEIGPKVSVQRFLKFK